MYLKTLQFIQCTSCNLYFVIFVMCVREWEREGGRAVHTAAFVFDWENVHSTFWQISHRHCVKGTWTQHLHSHVSTDNSKEENCQWPSTFYSGIHFSNARNKISKLVLVFSRASCFKIIYGFSREAGSYEIPIVPLEKYAYWKKVVSEAMVKCIENI